MSDTAEFDRMSSTENLVADKEEEEDQNALKDGNQTDEERLQISAFDKVLHQDSEPRGNGTDEERPQNSAFENRLYLENAMSEHCSFVIPNSLESETGNHCISYPAEGENSKNDPTEAETEDNIRYLMESENTRKNQTEIGKGVSNQQKSEDTSKDHIETGKDVSHSKKSENANEDQLETHNCLPQPFENKNTHKHYMETDNNMPNLLESETTHEDQLKTGNGTPHPAESENIDKDQYETDSKDHLETEDGIPIPHSPKSENADKDLLETDRDKMETESNAPAHRAGTQVCAAPLAGHMPGERCSTDLGTRAAPHALESENAQEDQPETEKDVSGQPQELEVCIKHPLNTEGSFERRWSAVEDSIKLLADSASSIADPPPESESNENVKEMRYISEMKNIEYSSKVDASVSPSMKDAQRINNAQKISWWDQRSSASIEGGSSSLPAGAYAVEQGTGNLVPVTHRTVDPEYRDFVREAERAEKAKRDWPPEPERSLMDNPCCRCCLACLMCVPFTLYACVMLVTCSDECCDPDYEG